MHGMMNYKNSQMNIADKEWCLALVTQEINYGGSMTGRVALKSGTLAQFEPDRWLSFTGMVAQFAPE